MLCCLLLFFIPFRPISLKVDIDSLAPLIPISANMRFSSSTVLAALPALAVAQDSPVDQYKAQFQNVIGQFASYIPNPGHHDPVAAAEAKAGSMRLNVLTLENWKETLYEPVAAGATTPEEWWLLVSGGNKTCYGMFDDLRYNRDPLCVMRLVLGAKSGRLTSS